MFEALNNLRVDWRNFAEASKITTELCSAIALNRSFLRELVLRAGDIPDLLALSEKHLLLDYLVVYDALDRGFRIRINTGTGDPTVWAHDHRFSFSTRLLSGGYLHTVFALPSNSTSEPSIALVPLLIKEEVAGSCFSLHHSAIHSTEKRAEMTSLFVRGPSEKPTSTAFDLNTDTRWERRGGQPSSNPVEKRKKMLFADYIVFCDRLRAFGVI
jgi:hypothetical protein